MTSLRVSISNAVVAVLIATCVRTAGAQCGDPAQCGAWGPLQPMALTNPAPGDPTERMTAIHAVLLSNGKVLCIEGADRSRPSSTIPDVVLLDPQTGAIDLVDNSESGPAGHPLYCSGHIVLPDGRVLFSGGGDAGDCGTQKTVLYDPDAGAVGDFIPGPVEQWCYPDPNCASPQEVRRWYGTLTLLGNGRVLLLDGDVPGTTSSTCDPTGPGQDPNPSHVPVILRSVAGGDPSSWTFKPLYDAAYRLAPTYTFDIGYYPFTFLLSNGKVFMAGSHYTDPSDPEEMTTRVLDTALETWTAVPTSAASIKGGSAVMYRKNTILKAGGTLTAMTNTCARVPVTNQAYVINPVASNPAWQQIAPMNHARIHF